MTAQAQHVSLGQPVAQIGFGVTDVRRFATMHSRIYGSGPFLIAEASEVSGLFRGEPRTFELDVAFGQWRDLQVEVMCQRTPGPGIVRDLHPEGQGGLHHFCSVVDDLGAAQARFRAAGYDELFSAVMPQGTEVVMFDTSEDLGVYTEMYEMSEEMAWLYDGVREASRGFDGSAPVRPLADYMPAAFEMRSS